MKKNIQINLYGTLYNIDEDAYQLLDNYLESMKRYFSRQEGGSEIADDIEHRVAELLWEKKSNGMEAVNVDIIKEIIGKIGNPEEIDSEGENQTEAPNDQTEEAKTEKKDWQQRVDEFANSAADGAEKAYKNVRSNLSGKKLYRDPNDKVLGGVCSGLAHYIGGDPVLWRIILVLVFLLEGFGLLLYLLLWLIVPLARTPEERLRMMGQPVNPDTLNEQILQDQNTTPVQHDNRGCLLGCFGILMLPFLFIVLIVVSGLIVGLCGALTPPFGYVSPSLLFSTSGFIWGIVFLVCGFIGCIWLIIHAYRHAEMKSSSKLMAVLLIILLFFLGVRGVVKPLWDNKDNIENFITNKVLDEADFTDDDDFFDDAEEDSTEEDDAVMDTSAIDTSDVDEDVQMQVGKNGIKIKDKEVNLSVGKNGISITKKSTIDEDEPEL